MWPKLKNPNGTVYAEVEGTESIILSMQVVSGLAVQVSIDNVRCYALLQ